MCILWANWYPLFCTLDDFAHEFQCQGGSIVACTLLLLVYHDPPSHLCLPVLASNPDCSSLMPAPHHCASSTLPFAANFLLKNPVTLQNRFYCKCLANLSPKSYDHLSLLPVDLFLLILTTTCQRRPSLYKFKFAEMDLKL